MLQKIPTRLFLFALLGTCFCAMGYSQSNANVRWVLAPSGLNLRETAEPGSRKLTTIEFGEQVEFLSQDDGPSLIVDQIESPMVKVQYGHQMGFIFAGYLCRFPPPERKPQELNETQTYVYELQEKGFDIAYESHFYENNGPSSEEDVFYLPQASWEEAFLITKALYGLPEFALFPRPSKSKEETILNPAASGFVNNDDWVIKRGDNGELLSLSYTLSTEGYLNIAIDFDAQSNSMRITRTTASC